MTAPTIKVKPLYWRNGCASTPIGDYLVAEEDWDDDPFWFIIFNGKPLNKLGEHKDEESAIAAAKADYERRILSAIDASALTAEVERLREALEAIAEVDDDGFTSDGHERCSETATRALAALLHAVSERKNDE